MKETIGQAIMIANKTSHDRLIESMAANHSQIIAELRELNRKLDSITLSNKKDIGFADDRTESGAPTGNTVADFNEVRN